MVDVASVCDNGLVDRCTNDVSSSGDRVVDDDRLSNQAIIDYLSSSCGTGRSHESWFVLTGNGTLLWIEQPRCLRRSSLLGFQT